MVPPKELILVGGGGHCRSCIEIIEPTGHWVIAGIIDRPELLGTAVYGHPVIGVDDDLPTLANSGKFSFLVTVGQINSAARRKDLFEALFAHAGIFATIISGNSSVSSRSVIGAGFIVLQKAIVNCGARVGVNCIINSGALLEHDTLIGNHCHVATRAVLNGHVEIGDCCLIGSNATLLQGIFVCPGTIIGAGALVNKNITVPGVYVGNPAQKIG